MPLTSFVPGHDDSVSRRHWLAQAGGGFGSLALAAMLHDEARAGKSLPESPFAPKQPHHPPRAQRVISLFMHGGPSHVDLFDPKPDLARYAGQPIPDSYGEVMTRRKVAKNPLLGPVKPFRPRGESGLEISDFLPHMATMADDLCVVRSCHGDSVNHPQSVYQMNTGSILMGRPSLGSWVAYGLGSENQNLPAFLVLPDPSGGIKGGPPAWGSGYLPATYQGTTLRPGPSPLLHLQPPENVGPARQRKALDLVRRMNADHFADRSEDSELAARINSYELAFRMQTAAPELVDLAGETAATLEMYGINDRQTRQFGTRCLLARRLIERGVRFVQLYSGDTNGWDAHKDVMENHTMMCGRTDKPVTALMTDLKQRGLMDDTLVIWGGEFGRMPMSEQGTGRDHNPWGFTTVFAGAGVKGGYAYGATDPIGLRAETNPVHIHDLHATILWILGMDHEQLTFFHNGRDERLTDVSGHVVHDILGSQVSS
ncbi:hypothetical protein Pan44_45700 [Caulifigura coniformis]|uniref:DUF1501 domain-containing protein n=1 Tax=Caulifigura coniformis TaxID=2527983 RepID=A0A517SK62_9PLAN|nr:DUF1501 domain-containing protein [Caulifigura coniformis]QDT56515.1 hypothetical protein Pan44_45700 [Caulifigura coniformis]